MFTVYACNWRENFEWVWRELQTIYQTFGSAVVWNDDGDGIRSINLKYLAAVSNSKSIQSFPLSSNLIISRNQMRSFWSEYSIR